MKRLEATQLAFILMSRILFSAEAGCKWNEGRYLQGAIITRVDFSLNGHTFKTMSAPSLLSCSHYCLKDSRCVSTNFRLPTQEGKDLCDLNGAGLLDGDENSLVPEKGAVFSQYSEAKVSNLRKSVCISPNHYGSLLRRVNFVK